MNIIKKYLKNYKKESFFAPLFKMLEASFELFIPLIMAAIIDRGIENRQVGYIYKMGALLVLLGIVGLICSITAQYFAAKAATGFGQELRHDLFHIIQNISFTQVDQVGTSTLINRITSDVNQVQNGVNMVLRLFLRSPFIVIGAMIMAFYVDVKAALIFAVAIPVLTIVVFFLVFYNVPLYKRVQGALDKVLSKTRENLNGVRIIRAFTKEEKEIEEFQNENDRLASLQIFAGKISALLNPITFVIINVALVVLLYSGALRVDGGYITQGQLVALVNYMSQILVELIKLANLIVTITKAVACASRIQVILDEPVVNYKEGKTDIKQPCVEKQVPFIEFCNVSFTYKDAQVEAISHLSFQVNKGETIGIIGGTGSGKSTLIQLIPRFYDVTSGCIKWNGENINNINRTTLRNKIGMVEQKASLFQGTIEDNVKFGSAKATREDVIKALEIAQAKEFVMQKDKQLDFYVEQGGRNLSGGQKQRLTIARALVGNKEVLILDDSSSALDFVTDAALRKALVEMNQDMTIFQVSQRTTSLMHASKIIVLEDGEVVGIGTHEELLEKCKVYSEIHESQLKGGSDE